MTKKGLAFVIHKHKASHLHYDFRLQIGGQMPSWAIPKGPSLSPKDKRLAIRVEDHPLEYRNFEGVIPEGQYGAGIVMIWDEGKYLPEKQLGKERVIATTDLEEAQKLVREGLDKGEIKLQLFGKKLKGSFTLVKIRPGAKEQWLLIKHPDQFAQTDYDPSKDNRSARTGRTFEEILTDSLHS